MTIEQDDVIDLTGLNHAKGEVELIICDHLPWDVGEGEHLLLLRNKLNAYLYAIESGQVRQI